MKREPRDPEGMDDDGDDLADLNDEFVAKETHYEDQDDDGEIDDE